MKKKKRKWLRRLIWLIVLALLGCGVYFIGLPMLKASVTVTYDTYTATTGSISNSLSFSASFALKNSETLYPSSASTVRTLYVAAGDDVKEGDKIMRLANGDTIKAGMDGRINTLDVAQDDSVTTNTELSQVVDFNTLAISIRVDEYDITEVSVGQACTITSTSQELSFDSIISSINYVSASSGNVAYYTATADVEVSEGIYPGMQATVTIPQESVENVVILKMDALSFDNSNQAYVWMKDENDALVQAEVEVGVDNGNYVEIVSGLSEGDTVYVEAEETAVASAFSALLSGMGGNRFNSEMGGGGRSGSFEGMPSGMESGTFPGGNSSTSGSAGSTGGAGGGMSSGGMPSDRGN